MCLKKIVLGCSIDEIEWQNGWKVFVGRINRKPRFLFSREICETNVVLKAKLDKNGMFGFSNSCDYQNSMIRAENGQYYECGFHLFASKEEAELYLRMVSSWISTPVIILPVKYRKVKCVGIQVERIHGEAGQEIKVVVAQEIMIDGNYEGNYVE